MISTLQLLTLGVIAFIGSGYAQDDMVEPMAAREEPVIWKACSLVSAQLVPEFSVAQKLEAGQKMGESAVFSEDESMVIHLKGPEVSIVFSVAAPSIKPMQWDAGTIRIMHRNGQTPIAVPPVSKHDAMFTIPPSLSHTFRAPHEQPPAMVPLTATAFTILPLLGLLFILSVKLGANVSALSVGGASAAAFSIAFLGCIGAALCLGVAFWVKLKLVDLFLPVGGLAVLTVLTGHQALSNMAEARMQKDKARKIE